MDKTIEKFKKGTQHVEIVSAVTRDQLTDSDHIHDAYLTMDCMKFVPSSGAATRMFEDLYKYLDHPEDGKSIHTFFDALENIAFYVDIKDFIEIENIDNTVF